MVGPLLTMIGFPDTEWQTTQPLATNTSKPSSSCRVILFVSMGAWSGTKVRMYAASAMANRSRVTPLGAAIAGMVEAANTLSNTFL